MAVTTNMKMDIPSLNNWITDDITGMGQNFTQIDTEFGQRALNVMWFGAKGDGVTDDTTAVQNAINAVINGGKLVWPQGSYKVTSLITATVSAGVTVSFEGIGNVTIQSTVAESASEQGIIQLTGTATSNLAIRNINLVHTNASFSQSSTAPGNVDGFFISTFNRVELSGVTVSGCTFWGAHLSSIKQGCVNDCNMSSNIYGGLGGESLQSFNVNGGVYNNNGCNLPNYGYGVSMKTTTETQNTTNVKISGVTANGNLRKGIDVHSGDQVVITGNFVVGFGDGGIYAVNEGDYTTVGKNTKDCIIANNYVDGTTSPIGGSSNLIFGVTVGGYGTTSVDSGAFLVDHNIIKNLNYSSIIVEVASSGGLSPRKVIISGNDIEYGSGSGYPIILSNTQGGPAIQDVVVTGNTMHTTSCTYGTRFDVVNRAIYSNNTLVVDSGTYSAVCLFPSTAYFTVTGNIVEGSGTCSNSTNPFNMNGSQAYNVARANIYQGKPSRDYVGWGITEEMATVAPTTGYYYQGSRVWNISVAAGGSPGWICTTTGNPATFKAMPAIGT